MVTIRGSLNTYDFLTDAQLWMAAVLLQCVRFFLPFGQVWTPVMPYFIEAISWLESDSLSTISFYNETTGFLEFLKQDSFQDRLESLQVVGHSLGGGLALISAVQANVPGIGVSAPNAMLSRRSFDPPLTVTSLDELTFNVVPHTDIVPQCDDLAQNYQQVRCLADTGTWWEDAVSCHDSRRTLCELIFMCGTQNRPALCECHYEFGYPKPTLKTRDAKVAPLEEQCAAVIERTSK